MPLNAEELELIRHSTTDEAAYARVVAMFTAREQASRQAKQRLNIYRQLARQFPNGGLYVVDHSLRYLVADGVGLRALGLDSEMLIGRTPREVFDAETAELVEPLYRAALGGTPSNSEIVFAKKTYRAYGMPLYDDDGSVMAGLLMVQDITEQKGVAEELLRQNQLLADMHQIALDMLNRRDLADLLQYIIQSVTAITHSNFAECSLISEGALTVVATTENLRHMLGDCAGRDTAKLMWLAHDRGEPVVLENYQEWDARRPEYDSAPQYAVIELPIMIGTECVGVLSLGRDHPNHPYSKEEVEKGKMLSRLTGLVYDNARLYVEALHEIAERQRYEKQALSLATERKRAEVLSTFIQHASHEFRTPLSVMQTSLYLMNRASDPEIKARKLAQVEKQIEHINRLIDMLVMQATVDSSSPLQREPVSLNLVIHSCIDAAQEKASENGLTVVARITGDLPAISADGELLNVAFSELIGNAIRYTMPGGEITVRTRLAGAYACVEVCDTGIGISAEDLPHIFERFYRRDHAHTTPGFGLGLSIAQRIIERHSGRIEVESADGSGTTFRVLMPL